MTEEVPLLKENTDYAIPTWETLNHQYDEKWQEEKEKFHNLLKENFKVLVFPI